MTTIETLGHRLLVVPVPGDATQFEFPDFGMLPIKSGFKIKCTFGEEHDPVAVHEYVVLGTCTAQGPDFDAGPYVEEGKLFLSLLAANGVHFQNPLGEEPKRLTSFLTFNDGIIPPHILEKIARHKAWQEAQAKVVEKVAVILIKP